MIAVKMMKTTIARNTASAEQFAEADAATTEALEARRVAEIGHEKLNALAAVR